jgi:hypothetical protein
MAVSSRVWRSSLTAIAVVAVAAVTPLAAGAPAVAATPFISRLCAPPADTVPPQLTSLTFSTQTIDLANGPHSVTLTAHATDSAAGVASGVQDIEVEFSGPRAGTDTVLNLVSGTPADGTWKGSVHFPRGSHDGTWLVSSLVVSDAQGNSQFYGRNGKSLRSPTDLRLHPDWDSSLTVTGTATTVPPAPGPRPGKLTGFRLAPKSVNTTRHAKTVRVTAAFSGHRPSFVLLLLTSEGDGSIAFDKASVSKARAAGIAAATRAFTRVASGAAAPAAFFFKFVGLRRTTHDHWVGHVKVGRWAGHVVAEPDLIAGFEGTTPRFKEFDKDRLQARHFTHSLKITSGVDTTKPVLKGLRVTPTSVDTTSGSQLVTITARATDKQSGLGLVLARIASRGGYDRGSFLDVRLHRNGNLWTGQAKIRECVPSGTWKVSVFLVDHAENLAQYSSKKLLALGLPDHLSVTSHPGDSDAPFVRSSTASGAGHMITLDFSEGVKNVTDSTLAVFALAPASARFQTPLAISHIVCSDGSGSVACSGSAALVTSAVLTVPDVTAGHDYQVWANLDSVTSQLTDGARNPLDWSLQAADVTGS